MNQQLVKPLDDMIRNAQIQVPDEVQEIIEEGLSSARTSWGAISSGLKDAAVVQTNATIAFSDQILRNVNASFDAAFDAVEALTKARTLPDVQKVQASFIRDHITRTTEQWNEWFSLVLKVGEEATATGSAMVTATTRTAKTR